MTRATFQHHSGASTDAEAKEISATLSLEGVAAKVSQPLLVITGDLDRLVPWRESKRIADEAPNATWKLYEGGNHVVNNMSDESKAFAADWLREQLSRLWASTPCTCAAPAPPRSRPASASCSPSAASH